MKFSKLSCDAILLSGRINQFNTVGDCEGDVATAGVGVATVITVQWEGKK